MRQVTSHVAPEIDLPLWRHLSSLAFRLTLSGAFTTRGTALPFASLYSLSSEESVPVWRHEQLRNSRAHAYVNVCVFVCVLSRA